MRYEGWSHRLSCMAGANPCAGVSRMRSPTGTRPWTGRDCVLWERTGAIDERNMKSDRPHTEKTGCPCRRSPSRFVQCDSFVRERRCVALSVDRRSGEMCFAVNSCWQHLNCSWFMSFSSWFFIVSSPPWLQEQRPVSWWGAKRTIDSILHTIDPHILTCRGKISGFKSIYVQFYGIFWVPAHYVGRLWSVNGSSAWSVRNVETHFYEFFLGLNPEEITRTCPECKWKGKI
jgi:hypothetical protein